MQVMAQTNNNSFIERKKDHSAPEIVMTEKDFSAE